MHQRKRAGIIIGVSTLFFLWVGFAASSSAFRPLEIVTVHAQSAPTQDFGLGTAAKDTPLAKNAKLSDAVAKIILAIMQFVAAAFLILIIYGGLRWMTSGGNEQSVATAKKIITSAAIGLAIVMLGYAIAFFVVSSISGAVNTPSIGSGGA